MCGVANAYLEVCRESGPVCGVGLSPELHLQSKARMAGTDRGKGFIAEN